LVTEKLCGPGAAEPVIVMFAVICVELLTVVLFSVIPAPTFTVLTPAMKSLPVKTTSSVCSTAPVAGAIPVNVGVG
jgi:hypothetical protein